MRRRIPLGPVAAVAAVLLWSTNALAAGEALDRLTVLQLLTLQYGSAAGALTLAALVMRRRVAPPGGRGAIEAEPSAYPGAAPGRRSAAVLVGVLGLTGTIFLQYLAFDTAPLIGANVICYADGLLAALWVAARRPSRATLTGVPLALVGFAGVIVVVTDQGDAAGGFQAGYLAAFASAVCMAFYSLASGRTGASTLGMLLPATLVGTALALGLTTALGEAWPPVQDWAWAVYIGLGPMAAGYALWTYAMAEGRADRLVPLCYTTPLVSTALLLATGRPATGRILLGAGLILVCSLGVLLGEWLYGRRNRRPDTAVEPGTDSPATDRPEKPPEGIAASLTEKEKE